MFVTDGAKTWNVEGDILKRLLAEGYRPLEGEAVPEPEPLPTLREAPTESAEAIQAKYAALEAPAPGLEEAEAPAEPDKKPKRKGKET